MKALTLTSRQKRRASSMMALGTSERDAAEKLIAAELYREAVVHLYFTCFYVSQAVLAQTITSNPSHAHLNSELHKVYGRHASFPRRYVDLHTALHEQRTEFDYRTTHTPDPDLLRKQLAEVRAYVEFALKVVPRVEVLDLLQGITEDNPDAIRDFSFDIYCPKTYSHHTRLTFWQPPFYLKIFGVRKMRDQAVNMLKALRVRRSKDYVVGLNSRLNQYKDVHLLMVDIDTVNPKVEAALKPYGGIMLKSGRGYHFIARKVIFGAKKWRQAMRSVMRHPILKSHIDKNHIEISMRRGYATLRVTSSPVKPTVPYFYKEI